jgi:hypothetical protein
MVVIALVLYLAKKLHYQYSTISFYENQGFFVYPGSKRPLLGMVFELWDYMKERESERLVEFELSWFYDNVHRFL